MTAFDPLAEKKTAIFLLKIGVPGVNHLIRKLKKILVIFRSIQTNRNRPLMVNIFEFINSGGTSMKTLQGIFFILIAVFVTDGSTS
ncbi:MAG: hypothetical protein ACQ9MH_21230, partial [Nitrospinales bacterium]